MILSGNNIHGNTTSFIWSNGTLTDIGDPLGGTTSEVYAINDAGTIVGYAFDTHGNSHAFSYNSGTGTDLGLLPGATVDVSLAQGINAAGVIVGSSYNSAGHFDACTWTNGVAADLGFLAGGTYTYGNAINSSGVVVGTGDVAGGDQEAFVYMNGTKTVLASFGGPLSVATSINDAGTIVGLSEDAKNVGHAAVWSNGTLTDLGVLPTGTYAQADAINNSGTIVGLSSINSGASSDAFVYGNGRMTDLNSVVTGLPSGVTLVEASAINDAGQIVAIGSDSNAYLLTPTTTSPTPSPSPTTTPTPSPTPSPTPTPSPVPSTGATQLQVVAPPTTVTGFAFNVTVTALDSGSNPVTGYNGTVHFTSSDSAAVLPADAALVNGVGTFLVTLNTVGTQTLQVADSVTSSISGASAPIAVGNPSNAFSQAVEAQGGLLAYYEFAGTTNSTVNGYTGSLTYGASLGGAGSGAPVGSGASGSALVLSGQGGNELLSSLSSGVSGAGTILAWVNLAALPSVAGRIFYVAGESKYADDFDLQIQEDNNIYFFTEAGASVASTTPLTAADLDTWIFIAATFTANNDRNLYVNGALVATNVPGGHTDSGNPFTIGYSNVFPGRSFDGSISNVAFYNTDRSAAQIAA